MTIKYIFCINSGRCGSAYLSELLSNAENVVSVHEEIPIMNGFPMQKFNTGDNSELCELMPLKIQKIRNKSNNGQKVYCETNHSFIKGWGYLIPDTYVPQEEIGVIILRRDVNKTAYSLLRIHDVPGASEWTRTWLLSPNSPRNLSKPADNANPYALCKWYVEETYLRAEEYKQIFSKIRYIECSIEQLNNYNFVVEMFAFFGLIPTLALRDAVGSIVNKRNEWPKLPLEELLAAPKYLTADSLENIKRDALINSMINYLQINKADQITKLQSKLAIGENLIMEVSRIVIFAERELEEVFKYSLKFTETEAILIWELLYTINPSISLLTCCKRFAPPGIRYTYNFNNILKIGAIYLQQFSSN